MSNQLFSNETTLFPLIDLVVEDSLTVNGSATFTGALSFVGDLDMNNNDINNINCAFVDVIEENSLGLSVQFPNDIKIDNILELTPANGILVDGVLCLDADVECDEVRTELILEKSLGLGVGVEEIKILDTQIQKDTNFIDMRNITDQLQICCATGDILIEAQGAGEVFIEAVLFDSTTIQVDEIKERTPASSVKFLDGLLTNNIDERTGNQGVKIDGVLIKDSGVDSELATILDIGIANATSISIHPATTMNLALDMNAQNIDNINVLDAQSVINSAGTLVLDDTVDIVGVLSVDQIDDSGAGFIILDSVKLPTVGGTASELDFYEEVDSNLSFPNTDFNIITSVPFTASRIGRMVTITIDSEVSLTAGAPGVTIRSTVFIPLQFRPQTGGVATLIGIHDNGADIIDPGLLQILDTGEVVLSKNLIGGAWTGGVQGGWSDRLVISYIV